MNNEAAAPITGAEIVVRCLAEEGVEVRLRLSRRRGPVHLRRALQAGQDPARPGAPRAGRGACRRRLCARSTGKVGVALVTSGPGVTNAVTGIATAYMDSIPMVVITGQVPTHAIGQDAFQECDTVGITRPMRQAQLPGEGRASDLASTMKKAFYIAAHRPSRPGAGRHPEGRHRMHTTRVRLSDKTSRCARTTRSTRATRGQITKAVQLLLAGRSAR